MAISNIENEFTIGGHNNVLVYFRYDKGDETSTTLNFYALDPESEEYFPVAALSGTSLVPISVSFSSSGNYRLFLSTLSKRETRLRVVQSFSGGSTAGDSMLRAYVDSPYL